MEREEVSRTRHRASLIIQSAVRGRLAATLAFAAASGTRRSGAAAVTADPVDVDDTSTKLSTSLKRGASGGTPRRFEGEDEKEEDEKEEDENENEEKEKKGGRSPWAESVSGEKEGGEGGDEGIGKGDSGTRDGDGGGEEGARGRDDVMSLLTIFADLSAGSGTGGGMFGLRQFMVRLKSDTAIKEYLNLGRADGRDAFRRMRGTSPTVDWTRFSAFFLAIPQVAARERRGGGAARGSGGDQKDRRASKASGKDAAPTRREKAGKPAAPFRGEKAKAGGGGAATKRGSGVGPPTRATRTSSARGTKGAKGAKGAKGGIKGVGVQMKRRKSQDALRQEAQLDMMQRSLREGTSSKKQQQIELGADNAGTRKGQMRPAPSRKLR